MEFPIEWSTEGLKTDSLIFNKKFKVYRGRAFGDGKNVSEERCYGVLSYEITRYITADVAAVGALVGMDGDINQIIAPLLSLEWARVAAQLLESGLSAPAGIFSYEEIEREMRGRGYDGVTLCPFYMPDTIGFYVMKNVGGYTTAEMEDFAAFKGAIESYLVAQGFIWLPQQTTWKSPDGALWNEKEQEWDLSGDSSAAKHIPRGDAGAPENRPSRSS